MVLLDHGRHRAARHVLHVDRHTAAGGRHRHAERADGRDQRRDQPRVRDGPQVAVDLLVVAGVLLLPLLPPLNQGLLGLAEVVLLDHVLRLLLQLLPQALRLPLEREEPVAEGPVHLLGAAANELRDLVLHLPLPPGGLVLDALPELLQLQLQHLVAVLLLLLEAAPEGLLLLLQHLGLHDRRAGREGGHGRRRRQRQHPGRRPRQRVDRRRKGQGVQRRVHARRPRRHGGGHRGGHARGRVCELVAMLQDLSHRLLPVRRHGLGQGRHRGLLQGGCE
mmetsp:Transcript_99484/g.214641  ORF Transcript_99484/g.214641 Transcript_99484/m.214641 type:complete len:278 (-) Transcript_99484:127-960(-)